MSDLVNLLGERGALSALDRHFAAALGRLVPSPPEVLLGAAFASRAVQHGHVCADLKRLAALPLLDRDEHPIEDVALPGLERWLSVLAQSPLVGDGASEALRPLVLDASGRLYLYRYHVYERRLAENLRARARELEPVDASALRRDLSRLFAGTPPGGDDSLQRWAAAVAAHRRFSVISGGPGTGKTHTVVKILALLVGQARALEKNERLRIGLFAPTGKAAQRLGESIRTGLAELGDPTLTASIPLETATIHRALGYQPRTPTQFRHHAHNPLPIDVAVIDEASMVDLALMTKLVDAVPMSARLVLLGDKDQLVSVEAGAILGDIYAEAEPRFSSDFAQRLRAATGVAVPDAASAPAPSIQDCLVHLTRSFRYPEGSAIAEFARAVNGGDATSALATAERGSTSPIHSVSPRGRRKPTQQLSFEFAQPRQAQPGGAELDWIELLHTEDFARRVGPMIDRGFAGYVAERDPRKKLELLASFRVLCAHRRGELGAQTLNRWVEERLIDRAGLVVDREFYDSRPLLITRNDYQLELYNGDVGVVAHDHNGILQAWFIGADGRLRSFLPTRLPPHETVFCMTVHKSQGSEFDRIVLVLPERPSPIVTRELLYTGVTRARGAVHLVAGRAVLQAAIALRVERASGLREALWAPEDPVAAAVQELL